MRPRGYWKQTGRDVKAYSATHTVPETKARFNLTAQQYHHLRGYYKELQLPAQYEKRNIKAIKEDVKLYLREHTVPETMEHFHLTLKQYQYLTYYYQDMPRYATKQYSWSTFDIQRLCNLKNRMTVVQWIKSGWLHATIEGEPGTKGVRYCIFDGDFEAFLRIRDHAYLYEVEYLKSNPQFYDLAIQSGAERWLTVAQLREFIHWGTEVVLRLIHSGELPSNKRFKPTEYRVFVSDAEHYVRSHRVIV